MHKEMREAEDAERVAQKEISEAETSAVIARELHQEAEAYKIELHAHKTELWTMELGYDRLADALIAEKAQEGGGSHKKKKKLNEEKAALKAFLPSLAC